MSKKESKEYNAEIDDGKELYPERLEASQIPSDSVLRLIHGQWRHLLFKDNEGKYHTAILPQAAAETITPSDLYDCLVDDHSYKLFCNKEHPGKKVATVALFVIVGFMLLIVFIMWGANLGKTPVLESGSIFPLLEILNGIA